MTSTMIGVLRPRLVSLKAAQARTGLRRTRLTGLLDQGSIASIKLYARRLIVAASLEAFLALQQERSAQDRRVRIPPRDTDLSNTVRSERAEVAPPLARVGP